MTDDTNHEHAHGSYERQDMTPKSVLYFLLILGVATIFSVFLLRGVFVLLDRFTKASQPAVNPLVTKVPEDTRHVPRGYPQTAFPEPRLEDDERNQLDGILTEEQDRLYTYGWIDEKAGTLHIPIDRAMDLLVQRGLPLRPQNESASSTENGMTEDARANIKADEAAKRR
jgi:hypothetical protein